MRSIRSLVQRGAEPAESFRPLIGIVPKAPMTSARITGGRSVPLVLRGPLRWREKVGLEGAGFRPLD